MSRQCRRSLGSLLCLLLAAPLARAAVPRDELLRFVPDDLAFCLVVQDLRGHALRLADSPLVEQVAQSPLGQTLAQSHELRQLSRLERQIKALLGIDAAQLRDDVLGEALIFAYRPGPPGQPEKEQGLILVRAREVKLLADLVTRLNALQKAAGELEGVEDREHEGIKYVRRKEKVNSTYYCLRGPVLIFSGQEELLRRALVQERALTADAVPPITKRLRDLGVDEALLAWWINPRAFDQALEAKLAKAPEAEAAFLKQFAVYWKALDDVALTARLDRELTVALALRARPDQLPAAGRGFLEGLAQPSDLWRYFPDNALLAVACRFNLSDLANMAREFLPLAAREGVKADLHRTLGAVLGKDLTREVLPFIGPDWGFCMLPPAGREAAPIPQFTAALRLAAGDGPEPLDQALVATLQSFVLVGVLAYNSKNTDRPVMLKTVMQDKKEVRYIHTDKGLPPGLRPAFGLSRGYLVVASSPAVLARFAPLADEKAAPPTNETPLVRVSLKEWRGFLQARRDDLSALAAERNRLSLDEAKRRLDGLVAGLQWVDRLDVGLKTSPGMATISLRLRTALPLRKP